MIDLSYTNKDGFTPVDGTTNLDWTDRNGVTDDPFNYHKDGKQDGDGYEHGGYPEITGETSDYPDTSYKTGDNVDFFDNGNVWEQPSVNPEPPVALVSIEITTPPTKVEYNAGEALSLAGLVVTGTYEDGSTKPITKYTATPANGTILSDETAVVIEYQGFSATQPITVIPPAVLESIEVTTPPTKVNYFEGDALDLSGLVVTAHYDDGTDKTVTATAVPANGTILSTDVNEVVLSFGGKETTQVISVEAVVLESIAVVEEPDKVEYNEGDTLDLGGLVVKAVYNNHEEIIDDYTTDPEDGAVLEDESEVVIHYEDKETSFAITVIPEAELVSIEITTAPTKVAYFEGDTLDLSGMVVTASYDDGSERIIANYTTTPDVSEPLTLGTTEFTVSYEDKEATQAISVVEVVLESIEITTPPTKIAYFEGDTLDLSGMVVTANYNNGHTEEVNDYTTDPEEGAELSVGTTEFTVSYEDKEATQTISVEAVVLESIAITTPPTKTSYFDGETLDLSGMVVTANYNNGHSETVSGYTADPADGTVLSLLDTEVVISYEGKTTTQAIIVGSGEISEIKVTKQPDKDIYDVGDPFDPTGFVLTAFYTNGTTKDVTSSAVLEVPAGTPLQKSNNRILVYYTEGGITYVTDRDNSIDIIVF